MKDFQHKNILVVGQPGSGKANFIDKLIVSLITERSADELRMILFDPKKVQFTQYSGIPHLLHKIVHNTEEARVVLKLLLAESLRRIKNIKELKSSSTHKSERTVSKMFEIVVVIEELADYMIAGKEFLEDHIGKITAFSDITGIYFIVATARPSSEYVLTETIMNCFENRICFHISKENSLHVLGQTGAEKLSTPGSCLVKNAYGVSTENHQMQYISDVEINEAIENQRAIL